MGFSPRAVVLAFVSPPVRLYALVHPRAPLQPGRGGVSISAHVENPWHLAMLAWRLG